MRPISCIQINLLSNVLVAPNRVDPLREGLSSTVKHKPTCHSHLRQPRLGNIRRLPQTKKDNQCPDKNVPKLEMSKLVNRFGQNQMDTIRTTHPECGRWRISCPENKLGKTYIKIRRIIPQSSECFLMIGNRPK